jgi:5'-nucleotidase/UDP-sugar diphosphatase
MNLMGYDAMTLGQSDLRLGKPVLEARMSESQFPFLSANAVLTETGILFASAYITKEIDGHRIAVVGLTGDYDPNPTPDFKVLDPLTTVQKLIPEVAKQADVIILLSGAGNSTDVKIAQAVPQIDLIIEGGPFQSFGQSTFNQENNTLLVHTDYPAQGHAGRNIGKTTMGFDNTGEMISQTWQLIPLDPAIADDPEFAQWRATK